MRVHEAGLFIWKALPFLAYKYQKEEVMRKAVMVVILIMVMALSATAFAEVKIMKMNDKEKVKVDGTTAYIPRVAWLCIDGYVFVALSGGGPGYQVYFNDAKFVQFFEFGPNGTSVPKKCE